VRQNGTHCGCEWETEWKWEVKGRSKRRKEGLQTQVLEAVGLGAGRQAAVQAVAVCEAKTLDASTAAPALVARVEAESALNRARSQPQAE
jgi:hypothetical protein